MVNRPWKPIDPQTGSTGGPTAVFEFSREETYTYIMMEFLQRMNHVESVHVDDGCVDAQLIPVSIFERLNF
jgi:hypothetical protein